MKLTGGPWGTFDQAEACLAPMTMRMLASRATAERLAVRREDSILDRKRSMGEDWKEKKKDGLALKTGERKGKGRNGGREKDRRCCGACLEGLTHVIG